MKYYKLTDTNGMSYGNTLWSAGVEHKVTGSGTKFCTTDLLHFYNHPCLAVIFNPIHNNYKAYRLWEIEAYGSIYSDLGLKFGAKHVKCLGELNIPTITLTAKIAFGILCTKQVCVEREWNKWADDWLTGQNRDAYAAAYAAAIHAHSISATNAAYAAYYAVYYAAYATNAAYAAYAVYATDAVYATYAATNAAYAATYRDNPTTLDFISLIREAMLVE